MNIKIGRLSGNERSQHTLWASFRSSRPVPGTVTQGRQQSGRGTFHEPCWLLPNRMQSCRGWTIKQSMNRAAWGLPHPERPCGSCGLAPPPSRKPVSQNRACPAERPLSTRPRTGQGELQGRRGPPRPRPFPRPSQGSTVTRDHCAQGAEGGSLGVKGRGPPPCRLSGTAGTQATRP